MSLWLILGAEGVIDMLDFFNALSLARRPWSVVSRSGSIFVTIHSWSGNNWRDMKRYIGMGGGNAKVTELVKYV